MRVEDMLEQLHFWVVIAGRTGCASAEIFTVGQTKSFAGVGVDCTPSILVREN